MRSTLRPTYLIGLLTLFFLFSCRQESSLPLETGIRAVEISAHRGGPNGKFPENAIETLQNTASRIPGVMMEVDVRTTSDGKLVLLHDRSLDRTTTLSGPLAGISLDELSQARLLGENGRRTGMKVPELEQVFEWISGKDAYLSLDIKDQSAFMPVVDLIREYGLEEQVEVITYTIDDARLVHTYAPEIHLSMSIGSIEVLQRVLEAGIDPARVAAFTGLSLKDSVFYASLKEAGMVVTLGTIGNLDSRAATRGTQVYREWKGLGIDRFATDFPFELAKVFREKEPAVPEP